METNHILLFSNGLLPFLLFFLLKDKWKRKDPNKNTNVKSEAQIKKWSIDGAMQPNYKLLQAVTLISIRSFDRFSIFLFLLLRNVLVLPRFRHLFMWFLLFGYRVDVYVGSVKRNRKGIHRSSVVTVDVNFSLFLSGIFYHLWLVLWMFRMKPEFKRTFACGMAFYNLIASWLVFDATINMYFG